jgi:chromosomal replication initiator protein
MKKDSYKRNIVFLETMQQEIEKAIFSTIEPMRSFDKVQIAEKLAKQMMNLFFKDMIHKNPIGFNRKNNYFLMVVCDHFNVSIKSVLSTSREANIVRARQVAMYFTRKYTNLSFLQIGNYYNRNHATVIYACQEIERLKKKNEMVKKQIEFIDKILCHS